MFLQPLVHWKPVLRHEFWQPLGNLFRTWVYFREKTLHTRARTLQYQRPSSAAQPKTANNFNPVPDQDQRINISHTVWTDTIGGFWVLEAAVILVIHQSRIWTLNRKDQMSRYSYPVKSIRNVSYGSMRSICFWEHVVHGIHTIHRAKCKEKYQ